MDRAQDPAALAADEPLRRIFRIVLTYQSCLLAVMLYDWLLSLKREYKYVWKQRFTLVTGLYVILRYFAFVRSSVTVYLADKLITNGRCPPWGRFQGTTAVVVAILAPDSPLNTVYGAMVYASAVYTLFLLRASAVYGNSVIVKIFLGTLASVILILQGIASTEFGTIPWATGHGACFAGKTPVSSNILVIFWLGPFVFDTITTAMLFVRIVIIRRQGGIDSSMVRLLARDGLLYFVIISAVNLLNVGFYLGASEKLQSMNSGAAYDVTSIACSRLILSLRHHANKQDSNSSGTRRGFTVGPSHIGSGVMKARSPASLHFDVEEKGMPQCDSGFRAHIALDTFDNTFSKAMDNESNGAASVVQLPPPAAQQGIFVLTETKTVVDEREP